MRLSSTWSSRRCCCASKPSNDTRRFDCANSCRTCWIFHDYPPKRAPRTTRSLLRSCRPQDSPVPGGISRQARLTRVTVDPGVATCAVHGCEGKEKGKGRGGRSLGSHSLGVPRVGARTSGWTPIPRSEVSPSERMVKTSSPGITGSCPQLLDGCARSTRRARFDIDTRSESRHVAAAILPLPSLSSAPLAIRERPGEGSPRERPGDGRPRERPGDGPPLLRPELHWPGPTLSPWVWTSE